ncbi:MAG: response regulator [Candidatus Auribacter fodinae]|jgi:signal transduction histidine kinase|uniref:histidine kinase n=1 Tax=Candidatus Auribacter fodinae TaxID=2093366 RepID=A0A3A4R774_9BACT|nr:MAG: response regulator [Candidatus Auribacter fodinae]
MSLDDFRDHIIKDKKNYLFHSTLVNTNMQLVRKIHELSIVKRINDSLKFVPDLKKVCCSIIDTIKDEINVKFCSLMVIDNEKHCLTLKAYWSQSESKAIFYEGNSPHYEFKLDEGVAGKVAKEGKPILINDTSSDERFVCIPNNNQHIKSLLCMPLQAGEETVGVLNLSHENPNAFGKDEKHLLDMITNQIAIALKNVFLFQEMQAINRTLENRVQERTQKLEDMNNTLIQTRDQLIHSEKMAAIGTLAGGVAHEFNNLLCMIQGYAELALQKNDPQMSQKALNVVLSASERAKTIAKNLLSFSKRTESKRVAANICEAMEETLTLIERDIEKDNIVIVRKYEEMPEVIFDVSLIQQVFLNIIINARHAMNNSKGGTLSVNIYKTDADAVVEISDTGPGIKKELLQKIFEPFFTTKGVWGDDDVPGTGLGLSVSVGVVESHNGKLEVESVEGQGATFRIRLPLNVPADAEIACKPGVSDNKFLNTATRKANVLVVDDEDGIRELLSEMLKISGHVVTTAMSGQEAVSACKSNEFDIIFMDIMMPGMSGVESFKEMKLQNGKPKVVFITGLNFDDQNRLMDLEGAECIKKPFKLSEISNIMKRLLKA